MRLYINPKEIEPLKEALRNAKPRDPDDRAKQMAVLERIIICEQLQDSCNRADKA